MCRNLIIIFFVVIFSVISCASKKRIESTGVKKLHLVVCSDGSGRKHIELIDSVNTDSIYGTLMQVADDRILMNHLRYDKAMRCAVMKEYLKYQGIVDTSDKIYPFYIGSTYTRYKISSEKLTFPVEIEALYSLTIMLFDYNVPIGPVLIDTVSGKSCNYDRAAMKEIYSAYKKWYKEYAKSNFKIIKWPLINTRYKWLSPSGVPIEAYLTK